MRKDYKIKNIKYDDEWKIYKRSRNNTFQIYEKYHKIRYNKNERKY